jgi:hypothetical protein
VSQLFLSNSLWFEVHKHKYCFILGRWGVGLLDCYEGFHLVGLIYWAKCNIQVLFDTIFSPKMLKYLWILSLICCLTLIFSTNMKLNSHLIYFNIFFQVCMSLSMVVNSHHFVLALPSSWTKLWYHFWIVEGGVSLSWTNILEKGKPHK